MNLASATHLSATLHLDDLNLEPHPYSPVIAYAQSKLALVTYTCWLAERLRGSSRSAVSLHPGVIDTRLLRTLFSMGGDPASRGAANIIHAATAADGTVPTSTSRTSPGPTRTRSTWKVQERLHLVAQDLIARST